MATGLEIGLTPNFAEFRKDATTKIINAVKRSMRKAANEIKQATVDNARKDIKSYNNHTGTYDNGNILDAVRVSRLEDRYDEDMFIKVHVMGYKSPPNKTFRFRMLEKGTKVRYQKSRNGKTLKKPRKTGKIEARRWFRDAKNSVAVENIYVTEIEKTIRQINNETA